METPSWSERVRDTFSGWRALVVTAVVTAAVTGYLSELWAAPEKAQRALELARETNRAVEKLDQTVRIYLCTRDNLDTSTRIRLDCREFE